MHGTHSENENADALLLCVFQRTVSCKVESCKLLFNQGVQVPDEPCGARSCRPACMRGLLMLKRCCFKDVCGSGMERARAGGLQQGQRRGGEGGGGPVCYPLPDGLNTGSIAASASSVEVLIKHVVCWRVQQLCRSHNQRSLQSDLQGLPVCQTRSLRLWHTEAREKERGTRT